MAASRSLRVSEDIVGGGGGGGGGVVRGVG